MFKLLKGEVEHVKVEFKGTEIAFDIKVITTAEQARLMDLGRTPRTVENIHRYWKAVLEICVDNLRIGNQAVDAADLAKRADLSHETTVELLRTIVETVEEKAFASEEEAKKSSSSPER